MNKFPYAVVRSRRRTISVTILGGRVLVRAPFGVSEETLLRFLQNKEHWIETKLSEQAMLAAKYRTVKNGESILDAGKVKAVFYGADKNTENDDSFFLKDPNAVRNFFEKTRGWILFECLHSFSRVMGVSPEKVSLGDFKARWGSCDAAKHIRLNWRLTMLPPALRDYVIVHELSHLCELNHSPAFWRIVQRFCPSYRSCRKQLREFSFLTDLYRRRKV